MTLEKKAAPQEDTGPKDGSFEATQSFTHKSNSVNKDLDHAETDIYFTGTSAEKTVQRITEFILEETAKFRRENPITSYLPDDSGRATAFGDYFGRFVKWNSAMGLMVYDPLDGVFKSDDLPNSVAYEFLEVNAVSAWDLRNAGGEKYLIESAKTARTAQSKARVLDLAKKSPALLALPEEFDADHYGLNCSGVFVNLRTGEKRPTFPEDKCTLSTNITPAPGEPIKFLRFLDENACMRKDLTAFKLRFYGYCLTGDKKCPYFLNYIGSGANGKSTETAVIQHVFGDYAITIPPSVIVESKRDGPRPDLVSLRGTRLGIVHEVPPGRLSGDIKIITGDDQVVADEKYKNPITFKPVIKLIAVSNHRLEIKTVDDAIRRRLRLVPFDYRVSEKQADPRLTEKLLDEAPQILNLFIQEAVAYLKNPGATGFPKSETIDRESTLYLNDEDIIGRFLAENTVRGLYPTKSVDLYKAYSFWAEEQGFDRKLGPRNFDEAVKSHGFRKCHSREGNIFENLSLRCDGVTE